MRCPASTSWITTDTKELSRRLKKGAISAGPFTLLQPMGESPAKSRYRRATSNGRLTWRTASNSSRCCRHHDVRTAALPMSAASAPAPT